MWVLATIQDSAVPDSLSGSQPEILLLPPQGTTPSSGLTSGCDTAGTGCYWHPVGRGQR